jgi:ubiquinone/menaquinone biosynthesis C-methylase UbiE
METRGAGQVTDHADGYVLPREDDEYQRLERQAKVWEEATRQTLVRAGLSPGQRCLDVGCGTGSVMRILGEMVGPTGSVLGIDLDERIGRRSTDILNHEQPGRHSFARVDITVTDAVAGAPFDVVFTRLFIFHMADPVAALRKLWAAVVPGGALVVMDFDLAPSRSVPRNETFERALDLSRKVFARAGRDISIGTNLPVHFVTAGIGLPDRADIASILLPNSIAVVGLRSVLRSLKQAGVAMGVADAAAFDALDADLERIAASPGFGRIPDMVSVIKRKPG